MNGEIKKRIESLKWERLDRQHPERGWEPASAVLVATAMEGSGCLPEWFFREAEDNGQSGVRLVFAYYRIKKEES